MDQQISGMEPGVDQASAEYVGRWNRLVSTTNWEKGRIISQWRERLEREGLPAASYTDEAWSLAVGNISPQHVGRLRRVYQRFGAVAESYPKLFWSHFQAAIDWDDAEMWLEGAVQSGWSVSQMRTQRWQAIGGEAEPLEQDLPAAEFDEDSEPPVENSSGSAAGSVSQVYSPGPSGEGPDFGDETQGDPQDSGEPFESTGGDPSEPAPRPVRPFENLPNLPRDLAEALEQFKLALLKHKVAGWVEVPCDHVLASLDALKQLVLAP